MIHYLTPIKIAGHELTPWPDLICTDGLARPEFCSSNQLPAVQLFLNMLEATGEVPDEVMKAVRAYKCCQLPILSLAGQYPERFLTLFEQSPALLMAVATNLWLNPRPFVAIYTVQRGIWGIVSGASSRSFARQMARIPAELVDPDILAAIRVRWVNSAKFRRLFRHAPRINQSVLKCFQLLHDDELLPSFIRIASKDKGLGREAFSLIHLLITNHHMMRPLMPLPYQNLESIESLQRALGRQEEKFLRQEVDGFDERFTVSYRIPFSGNHFVQPVSNSYRLWKTSSNYSNCAFRYHQRIIAGLAAVYVVPSRNLTVLLEKVQGKWQVTALERPCGCAASKSDWDLINLWKKENNI